MTEEKQRIAIAEACGWKDINPHDAYLYGQTEHRALTWPSGINPDESDVTVLPNYLTDLNAMRDAVVTLHSAQRIVFAAQLYLVAVPEESRVAGHECTWIVAAIMLGAGPDKWAEAFLRTIGKWEDGE